VNRRTILSRIAMVLALTFVAAAAVPTQAKPSTGKKFGAITGVVVDQDGVAVSGASVRLFDGAGNQLDTILANGNGEFEFARLRAGDYSMLAFRITQLEYLYGDAIATVTAGEITYVTIVVERSGPVPL